MRIIPLLVLLACMLAPRGAHAQDTVAETEFKAAKKLYDEGQFKEALQMFQLAWDHSHSPNARLFVARCFLRLDNIVAAYDEFRGTLRDATDKIASDPKYEGTQNSAAAELVLLEPRIGKLIVTLDAQGAEGAKVTVNGEPYPDVSLGEVRSVTPGHFTVVASAPGKRDVVREVEVEGGRTSAVALWFAPDVPVVPGQPKGPTGPQEEPGLTGLEIGGIIVGSVGLATLLAAAGTGIAASSKFGALEQGCGADTQCQDPRFGDIIDAGKTYELVTYILLGVGGAATIAGGAMYLFGGESEPEPPANAAIVPLPGGAFISLSGAF